MSTARRDTLLTIEKEAQKAWEANKIHEWNAPAVGEPHPTKFFTTFPFPYMNGMLHLGHGFSLTKAEFTSRFQRMKGRNSLWAFGFHVTGTPIAACAQKIQKEMQLYGCPPVFPDELLEQKKKDAEEKQKGGEDITKHRSKRGKQGPALPQWKIMQAMGIPDSEIPKFSDPDHWLSFFPPLAIRDLHSLGCHIDFRRSFITTDRNPYFDRFVQWQFRKLYSSELLRFGKRHCIYSPWDGQPCADHDRASGEGALPQEYTIVKLRVQNPLEQAAFAPFKDIIGDRDVILPGATLRPETVIGQTNCWVSPTITYRAYTVVNKAGKEEVYIMTARAARNMAYQDFVVSGKTGSDPSPLFEVAGPVMIGVPLSAPLCPYETIYTLPMETISEGKGTGVVMCVPSDSPDDYINFNQLLVKPQYRAKLGLKDEWVVPFAMIPIIDIPELGTEGAKFMCEKLKITGPKDAEALEEAKKVCYQKGFYEGVMIVGPFTGHKVSEAKVETLKVMEAADQCIRYYEPVRQVMSRSGDECVVAFCEQWYLSYGKPEWMQMVVDHVEKEMVMYSSSVRHGFMEVLNWLADWPCSRTFGLGTKLPNDASHSMIIDSLSDSTIYMAYYTIAVFLHTAADGTFSLRGCADNAYGLKPEMFTDEVFDYIYHGTGLAANVAGAVGMPEASLELMRNEFLYWYPVDLRCSGKDLIQNHLTMFLYNHAAIWPTDSSKWPRSIYCNGQILVDTEKMSKSVGNFITVREAIDTYGADPTRLACADAGDSLDDANFVRETAAGFVLKLTTILEQSKEQLSRADSRTGEWNEFDKIFNNILNDIILRTENAYATMQFRLVLSTAFHELTNEYSQYRLNCGQSQIHGDLQRRYYEVLTLLMAPLAPHFSEYMWQQILAREGSVVEQRFPTVTAPLDYSLVVANRVMTDVVKEIRSQVTKNAKKRGPIDTVVVYTVDAYAPWQLKALELLQSTYEENGKSFPAELTKQVMSNRPEWMTKDIIPDTMAFLSFVRANVEKYGDQAMSITPIIDDFAVLTSVQENLNALSGVENVQIRRHTDEEFAAHAAARRKCRPGEPTVAFPPAPAK